MNRLSKAEIPDMKNRIQGPTPHRAFESETHKEKANSVLGYTQYAGPDSLGEYVIVAH